MKPLVVLLVGLFGLMACAAAEEVPGCGLGTIAERQQRLEEQRQEIQKLVASGVLVKENSRATTTEDVLRDMKQNLSAAGVVTDAAMAVAIGEIVLKKKYGDALIEKQKPFQAKLVNANVWMVRRNTEPLALKCEIAVYDSVVAIRKSDGAILGLEQVR